MTGVDMQEITRNAAAAADEHGMCNVRARIDGVRDNGKTYAKGQEFHMHKDLVPAHVETGQVELLGSQRKGSPSKK